MLIGNALKQRQLSQEVATLREQLKEQSKYTMLFGNSERMAEVRDLIDRVSDTDVTVLIRGESGTGKELVARALHEQSLRKDKPFVKVNCAALPTELLESELFGFEKGAFTGAIQHKPGKFEFANHGTMFLDEIGDMSFPLQAKLLQVLQDGEFSRLGGKADVQVDVRVIAATNRDLETAVAEGQFREDLYFRLNVVTINLPPLRERREEIPDPHRPLPEEVLGAVQQAADVGERRARGGVHALRLARQRAAAREPDQADGRARHRGADPQGAAAAGQPDPVPAPLGAAPRRVRGGAAAAGSSSAGCGGGVAVHAAGRAALAAAAAPTRGGRR